MKKRINDRLGVRLLLSLVFFLGSASAFGQPPGNVDIDNSAPPVVIDSIDDIGDVNVNAGKLLVIRSGAAAGVHYYSAESSATVDSVDVLDGPDSVGRWLRVAEGAVSDKSVTFDTVTEMLAATGVKDGQVATTTRYSSSHTVGDGSGGEYVYDADSEATIDGGFVLPGIGGTLSFSGTTFNGTAGVGRWLAKDKSVAHVEKFGSIANDSSTGTKTINDSAWQRAINSANRVQYGAFVSSSSTYFLSATLTIDKAIEIYGSTNAKFALVGFAVDLLDVNTTVRRTIKLKDLQTSGGISALVIRGQGLEADSHISNCTFNTCLHSAIRITGGFISTQWDNVKMASPGRYGLYVSGSTLGNAAQFNKFRVTGATGWGVYIENTAALGVNTGGTDCIAFYSPTLEHNTGGGLYVKGSMVNLYSPWIEYNSSLTRTVTADAGADTLASTMHALPNNLPVQFTTTGTLPAGLSLATTYYVVEKTDDTFKVAATVGGAAIDITDAGTGTHTCKSIGADIIVDSNYSGGTGTRTYLSLHDAYFSTAHADVANVRIKVINHLPWITVYNSLGVTTKKIDHGNFSVASRIYQYGNALTVENSPTFANRTFNDNGFSGSYLILGAYHLWVDATGDLRINNGIPASDTSGTVVGTQN